MTTKEPETFTQKTRDPNDGQLKDNESQFIKKEEKKGVKKDADKT